MCGPVHFSLFEVVGSLEVWKFGSLFGRLEVCLVFVWSVEEWKNVGRQFSLWPSAVACRLSDGRRSTVDGRLLDDRLLDGRLLDGRLLDDRLLLDRRLLDGRLLDDRLLDRRLPAVGSSAVGCWIVGCWLLDRRPSAVGRWSPHVRLSVAPMPWCGSGC